MKRILVTLTLVLMVVAAGYRPASAGGSIQSFYQARNGDFVYTNIFMDARTLPWDYSVSRVGLPAAVSGENLNCPLRATTPAYGAASLMETVFVPNFQRWTDNPLSFFAYQRGSGTEKDGGNPSNRDGFTDTTSTGFDGENVQTFTEPQLATPAAAVVAVSLTTELAAECRFDGPFKPGICSDGSTTDFPNGLDFNGDGVLNEPFSENFASLPVDGSGNFVDGPLVFQPGTIIDGDVSYNGPCVELSNDNAPATIDIFGVALHENGHGHGLSHQLIRNATMFPFVSDNVFSLQTPQADDMISSSLLYPVAGLATFASGTANSTEAGGGNRQYEASTVLSSNALGLIRGEVVDAAGEPVFGAHVFAVAVDVNTDPAKAPNAAVADLLRGIASSNHLSRSNFDAIDTGDAVVGDYSGTLLLGANDSRATRNGAQSPDPDRNQFVLANLLPGRYAIGVESIDGDPVTPASISGTVLNIDPADPIVTLTILPEFYSADESGVDETQVAKGNKRAGGEPGTSGFELDTAPANTIYFDVAPGQVISGVRIVINRGVDGVGDELDADSAFANDVPLTRLESVVPGPAVAAGQTVTLNARAEDDGATIGATHSSLPQTSNVDEAESTVAFLFSVNGALVGKQITPASVVAQPADGRGRDVFNASATAVLGEGTHVLSARAVDTENDEGPQSTASTRVVILNDDNGAIEYVGGWHRASSGSASFGSYRRMMGTSLGGSRAVVSFTGEAITYAYATSSGGGSATLLVDGVPRQTVSYAGQGTNGNPRFGASVTISGLAPGAHTLEIRPISGAVFVDGFLVQGASSEVGSAGVFRSGSTQSTGGTASALQTVVTTVTAPSNAVQISSLLEWTGGGGLSLSLLDSAGTLLASGGAGQSYSVVNQALTAGGTYTVVISNTSLQPVSYTLTTTPTVQQ
ncbi:MAG TPA: matrixin family metalloprotease [Thermoanaerobaculia bacterium]